VSAGKLLTLFIKGVPSEASVIVNNVPCLDAEGKGYFVAPKDLYNKIEHAKSAASILFDKRENSLKNSLMKLRKRKQRVLGETYTRMEETND